MEMKKTLAVETREEWHAWLKANHDKESELWLVYYKKHTGKPSIPYGESVEEALCFGWIDSIIQKIDEDKYARKFTPRKDTSNWSELNKKRIRKLVKEGRMLPVGMAKVDFPLDEAEDEPGKKSSRPEFTFSDDLLKILKANPKAWEEYQNLPPSHKRNYTGWIMSAKKEETRLRRLTEAIKKLEKGERLGLK